MTAFKFRHQKVVADMAATFLNEGYEFVLKVESVSLMFYKLRHRSNGNTIIVKGYPKANSCVIMKNGREIKRVQIIATHETEVH